MEEWKKEQRINPKDSLRYFISEDVIENTVRILQQYGAMISEGLVYWVGKRLDGRIEINTCIAPSIDASRYHIEIDHAANLKVVEAIHELKLVHIGQVHSHPFEWVGHSWTDDAGASFKINGLLSIVVPDFSKDGMLPLSKCGVHRFHDSTFFRLANRYVKNHFHIVNDIPSQLIDLRNEPKQNK